MKSTFTIRILLVAITLCLYQVGEAQWANTRPGYGSSMGLLVHNGSLYSTSGADGVYMTSDGTNWTQQINGLNAVAAQTKHIGTDGTYLYVGTPDGVYRSNDNGNSWNPTDNVNMVSSATNYGRYFHHFNGVTFCVTSANMNSGGGVFRSTDNGTTWTLSAGGIPTNEICMSMLQIGSDLFMGTNFALYKSTDNGLNWTVVPGLNAALYNGLYYHNGRFIALSSHPVTSLHYSDDDGATWQAGTGDLKGYTLCGIVEGANDTLFAFAGFEGVFYSIDDGASWVDITGNITGLDLFSLADIAYFNDDVYVAYSSGVFTDGQGGANAIEETIDNSWVNSYPNPTKDQLTINASDHVRSIEIFDLTGKRVELHNTLNTTSLQINVSHLPSGAYMMKVNSNSAVAVRRFNKL